MNHQLRVFIAVVENRNFSRAAEKLHMTQPAVSQTVRSLEESLGVPLLERTSKYVRLNRAGEIVYHHAKEMETLDTRMRHLLDDLLNKAKGPLKIGASYTFGEYILPRAIAKMKERFPDILPTVKIGNTSEIARLVDTLQFDIGIVEGHFKEDRLLHVEPLAEDSMVVVASSKHPISRINHPTKHELEKQTWIVREKGSGTREASESFFKTIGISPASVMEFGSTQSIKQAIEAGLGLSLLSTWTVQKEIKNQELTVIESMGAPFKREFTMVFPSPPFRTKAMDLFIDLLREEFNRQL
ncbi:LysR family transcriptional regulator [Bacillus methanolicus]|uniref:LysR family transcriptional regulator n=1 Tax=Bacillus methanolicus TaxID=1471 RepID=UPI00200E6B78|nr:LysR family transcriptional regulator [Bacillus methanolicus]UQD50777.1 LysR family transcriptional regulator [Bacillus methanolicus]